MRILLLPEQDTLFALLQLTQLKMNTKLEHPRDYCFSGKTALEINTFLLQVQYGVQYMSDMMCYIDNT